MSGSASLSSLSRWVGGVLAVGAVAAAAGCSSAGSSSAPAAPAAPASSAASSAPASSPASSSAPATAAGSSAATTPAASLSPRATASASGGSGGTGGSSGGPAGCATRDLRAALGTANGAAGSVYLPVEFTNVSSATCTLYGYPGVSLLAGSPPAQVGAAASRTNTAAPTLVTLAPGQTANALLRVVDALNYPTATCSPTPATELRVYPPNQTAPIDLPFKSTGCASTSVNLMMIGVVQAGNGSNGQ